MKHYKNDTEYPYYDKQTHFYSLAKENGGIKLIAANNFNTSILSVLIDFSSFFVNRDLTTSLINNNFHAGLKQMIIIIFILCHLIFIISDILKINYIIIKKINNYNNIM